MPDRYGDGDRAREESPRGERFQQHSEEPDRGDSGRFSETGEQGDWGRQGSWGTYGNHPSSEDQPAGRSQRGGEPELHGEERSQSEFSGRELKGYQRSDDRIREDVNERLTDHPGIDATGIEVQVKAAEVTLNGTVDDPNMKQKAEEVAGQVSGMKGVHNQLRVGQRQKSAQESAPISSKKA